MVLVEFGTAVIKSAASAASSKAFPSRDQVGCQRGLPKDQIQGTSSRGAPDGDSACGRQGTVRSPADWSLDLVFWRLR